MLIFGTWSLIPLAIVAFGAYHVWKSVNAGLSKLLHHWHEDQIKTWSLVVIIVSVLIMSAPLLIPTSMLIKEIVFGLYVLYVGNTVVHAVKWYQKRNSNNSSSQTDNTKNDKSK